MLARLRALAYAGAVLGLLANEATAAVSLARRRDVFTVNGQAKFLVLVSYFDGLDAGSANWARDFAYTLFTDEA